MNCALIVQDENIVLVIGSGTHTINKTHPSYQKIISELKSIIKINPVDIQNSYSGRNSDEHTEPNVGSSTFYKGYNDGFKNFEYRIDSIECKDQYKYKEGFDKGTGDRKNRISARYRYLPPLPPVGPIGW